MLNNFSNTISQTEEDHLEKLARFDRSTYTPKKLYIVEFLPDRINIIGYESVRITDLKTSLSNDLWDSFKSTLIHLTEVISPNTLVRSIRCFKLFINGQTKPKVTVKSVLEFHETCKEKKWDFSPFKMLMIAWHRLGLPGVDDDTATLLSNLFSHNRNRPAGSRVRSDNQEEGWYSEQEYDELLSTIWSDYETGKSPLFKTLPCLLSAQYGRRPIQLAQLKIIDLQENGESCGVSGKRIEFPGAKEKYASGFRQAKIEVHPMGDELWVLCQQQVLETTKLFETLLERKLSLKEISGLPLFPAHKNLENNISLAKKYSPHGIFLNSQYLHSKAQRLSQIISRCSHSTTVISHRTGLPLVENAYRMRYTRARQLARMGIPPATLQYWLGHESAKAIQIYYDDPAERARKLNDCIAPIMAPLAQAFFGTLRDRESDAIRGSDPSSRVELDGREEYGVGTCGEHGFCDASVPIPCYRCSKFQPWVYGPHEEVLERLLERQRIEDEIPKIGSSRRILIPLQLEKDISAVRLVIDLCRQRKKELESFVE